MISSGEVIVVLNSNQDTAAGPLARPGDWARSRTGLKGY